MIDLVKLRLAAGDGGHGRISFRREKYVPKGGPDGGNGGNGGNIVLRGTNQLSTLQDFSGVKEITAQHGQPGGKQKMMGAKGHDTVLEVPVGTVVWLLAENENSRRRRQRYGVSYLLGRDEVHFDIYEVEKEGKGIPYRPAQELDPILHEPTADVPQGADEETLAVLKREARLLKKVIGSSSDSLHGIDLRSLPKQQLVEITEDGQEVIICQGGFGGHGNTAFKGPSRTTPLIAEYGTEGEQKVVVLEQRLLADIGLVGFPSVGKSTLLSVITDAKPKIAAYPFTTLEPHLGVLRADEQELVVADLPGLIEGASEGKGLGYAFLRHVEHCRVLIMVIALEESVVFDPALTSKEKAEQALNQLLDVRHELEAYGELLAGKEQLVGISKADLYDDELRDALTTVFSKETKQTPLLFSASTGEGVGELKRALLLNGRRV